MIGIKLCATLDYNFSRKHAREMQFVPESSLDSPASENLFLSAIMHHLQTGNDQQMELLRIVRISMFNGIFVHRAERETTTE